MNTCYQLTLKKRYSSANLNSKYPFCICI
jgi:hypothetical protein